MTDRDKFYLLPLFPLEVWGWWVDMLGLTNIVLWIGIACEEDVASSLLISKSQGFSKGSFECIRASSKDLIFLINTYFSMSTFKSLKMIYARSFTTFKLFKQFVTDPLEFTFFHHKIDKEKLEVNKKSHSRNKS
jgi:hypothetical protein